MTHDDCNGTDPDGTDPDAAHWREVWAAMDHAPTADELVRSDATGDQHEAAVREAQRYDTPGLKSVPDVYDRLRQIMTRFHSRTNGIEVGLPQEFVEMTDGPGCATFNKDDPASWITTVLGIVAGRERTVHVLRGDYTPERWLEDVKAARYECEWWDGPCADTADGVLTFVNMSLIVAIPTCWACRGHLLAGGSRNAPVTHLGV